MRFSIFLTPAGGEFSYFDRLICQLCGQFQVPPFEPHVTVYSGTCTDPDHLQQNVARVIAAVPPFTLQIHGTGCSERYFKTLYVQLREHDLLRSLHDDLQAACGRSGYILVPHLSLLYCDLPLHEKQELADRLTLQRSSILFDSVKIVVPPEGGWGDTGRWSTLKRYLLGPLDSGGI